jgi:CheY-like chemotaxis protein
MVTAAGSGLASRGIFAPCKTARSHANLHRGSGTGSVVAGQGHERQAKFAELQTIEDKAFVGFVQKGLRTGQRIAKLPPRRRGAETNRVKCWSQLMPKRILVIDDEEAVRLIVREMLILEGYEVEIAANGKVGLQLFRSDPTDLIITDIFMPEMEGLETIRELHREYPGVKIIAMSGGGESGMLSFLSYAKRFGALRTLRKPFSREELLANVQELLAEE